MHGAGLNASPTNVMASPIFINVSPTVKVIPNSNKVPTYAANIAIKPNPDPGTVTNEFGKVPSLKLALDLPLTLWQLPKWMPCCACCSLDDRRRILLLLGYCVRKGVHKGSLPGWWGLHGQHPQRIFHCAGCGSGAPSPWCFHRKALSPLLSPQHSPSVVAK